MGQASTDCLLCLLILIVLSLSPGSGAGEVTITVNDSLVQSGVGWNTTLSVANGSDLFSVVWLDPTGNNILTRLNGMLVIKPDTQYKGRVDLQANNSLTIRHTNHSDEGTYTVTMEAPASKDLTPNTKVLRLEVYDPVTSVSVVLSPSDVFDGNEEVHLTCSALTGSRVTYTWRKGSCVLSNSSHVTVAGNEVWIQPVNCNDAGSYTCTVHNAISTSSHSERLTVHYYCLSVGAIVGIAIGAAIGLLLLILLIIFLVRRKRAQKNKAVNKPPLKTIFNQSEAKVVPWMNDYPEIWCGISPTPIYSADQMSVYSIHPPSTGSMVASTEGREFSLITSRMTRSGKLSTLV